MPIVYGMRIVVALLVSLLAFSFLAGCTHRPRCEAYHFHRTFPQAYQASARAAVAKWSTFSGDTVTIVDGDPEETECSLGSVGDSSTPEYQDVKSQMDGQDFYAAHLDTTGQIVLAEGEWVKDPDSVGREADFATSVLMHEVAHEYGLMHVADGPDAVMGIIYPGTNLEYNTQDRAEFSRVTGR